ncbi:MAG: hypothetical protein Ct9H300mP27_03510 [Chloroflexota bacterium]|nr:MAG: hypothetical protein Ct9H300mP27_03510 [Chloroflexota bacterium]
MLSTHTSVCIRYFALQIFRRFCLIVKCLLLNESVAMGMIKCSGAELKKKSRGPPAFFFVSAIDYLFFSNNLGNFHPETKECYECPAAAIISMLTTPPQLIHC